jgi:hypothetical protein
VSRIAISSSSSSARVCPAGERALTYDFVKTVALSTDFQIAEFEFRNDLACRQKEGLILLYLNSTLGEL